MPPLSPHLAAGEKTKALRCFDPINRNLFHAHQRFPAGGFAVFTGNALGDPSRNISPSQPSILHPEGCRNLLGFIRFYLNPPQFTPISKGALGVLVLNPALLGNKTGGNRDLFSFLRIVPSPSPPGEGETSPGGAGGGFFPGDKLKNNFISIKK